MQESDLIVYRRGSHTWHYEEFEKFCEEKKISPPQFKEYGLTPKEAAAVLEPKAAVEQRPKKQRGRQGDRRRSSAPTVLLECSLPMAMAICSQHADLKIVAFLDMAKVEQRQNSCSVYYHLSAMDHSKKTEDDKLQLLVPSLQSMTAVFGAPFIRDGMRLRKEVPRRYDYCVEHNTFRKIIEFLRGEVERGADITDYVLVLDEVNRKPTEMYEKELLSALGDEFKSMEKRDLFKWAFDQYAGGEGYENYEIPGMVLVANEDHLSGKGQMKRIREVDKFLKKWQKYRNSKPALIESKSLGPCGWSDPEDMRNLLDLAALIAWLADDVVGIERSLQVHKDFLDVAPLAHPDKREGIEALENFSAALETELRDWVAAAEKAPGPLNEARINLEKRQEQTARGANHAREVCAAVGDVRRARRVRPKLVKNYYRDLKAVCKQLSEVQHDLSHAFEQIESVATTGLAALHWGGRLKKPEKL
jgi:hypothetical protein